jgi:3-phosphoshikimate 1-carboxyvinyltransferase
LLQRSKAGQLRLITDADRRARLTHSLREKFHNSSMELRIKRAPRIDIEITVPGDKSISHRAVIIAALSNGVCTLRGFLPSEDCMHTVNAMRALGIKIEQPQPDTLIVHGKKRVLTSPKKEIDCGNSGTTMRLLAGLLAGQTFESRLVGDAGLSRRPMDRVIAPLHKMGASILAEGPEQTPPLRIHGGSLRGIRHRLPVASAQVKSALLLAGLFAKGRTTVDEPSPTRNHTEVLFNYFLVRTATDGEGSVAVFGDQVPESRDFTIPGDISSAAFWLVAAAAQPRGHLLVREVGLNDTRTALLGVLLRMGAQVREAIEDVDQLEPRGIVEVTGVPLKGTVVQGREVPQLIDELPILAVAGVLANGKTIIRQAQELRVKESDRIAAIAHNLRAMGAQVTEMNDGLEVHGPAPLHGARVASFGDHRIAMAFAIAGLFAEGETIVQDAECIGQSYPGFGTVLDEFTNPKRMQISTPVIGSLTPTPVEEP